MTDRGLLEAAAKAAGLKIVPFNGLLRNCAGADPAMNMFAMPVWNPLTDDGDALRLAVKLRLQLSLSDYGTAARIDGGRWHWCEAHLCASLEDAARRAIVRAAWSQNDLSDL